MIRRAIRGVRVYCHRGVPKDVEREVRRVNHELADPAFMYAGERIRRDAILCRNAEIDELRKPVVVGISPE